MPLNSYKSMGEKYSELNLKMDEITTHLSELLVYPDYKATKTLPSTSEFKANTNCICIEEVRAGSVLYDEIYINGCSNRRVVVQSACFTIGMIRHFHTSFSSHIDYIQHITLILDCVRICFPTNNNTILNCFFTSITHFVNLG